MEVWVPLTELLKEQLNLHYELLEMAGRKETLIIENDVQSLLDLLQDEEEVLQQVRELEQKRKKLLDEYFGGEERSFSDLLEEVPGDVGEELENLRQGLLEVIDKLQEKNHNNASLINEALDLNEFSIQLFTGDDEGGTYSPGGEGEKKSGYSFFDQRA